MIHNVVHMLWYSLGSPRAPGAAWRMEDTHLDFCTDLIDWMAHLAMARR